MLQDSLQETLRSCISELLVCFYLLNYQSVIITLVTYPLLNLRFPAHIPEWG